MRFECIWAAIYLLAFFASFAVLVVITGGEFAGPIFEIVLFVLMMFNLFVGLCAMYFARGCIQEVAIRKKPWLRSDDVRRTK